ncbi:MAG: Cytochrome c oxidase polypeptide III [Burkholderiaceae bacterium]|jgi:cytochrome c oxidase subunit 3|nr:MAG: Cytochrome c oxidase polypeptide III [Burkholderiaceae bacterium]
MTTSTGNATPYYFVPAPSRFPATTAFGLLLVIFGATMWINERDWGMYVFVLGLALWLVTLFQWFWTTAHESEHKNYGHKVDLSFRWSMSWFIFSEVLFFGAFFTALWWTHEHSVPMLGSVDNAILWPDFKAAWPSAAPGITASPANLIAPFTVMTPFWIPTINTALLLSSAVTVTIAHHLLRADRRALTIVFMWITVILGASFLGLQSYEYIHAYTELNLKLTSGVYGSTFFMLTGFHGFHVFIGTLMLISITIRLMSGHFTPKRHFGFEGAAWYWHFVDVVWLGLYVFVYWL